MSETTSTNATDQFDSASPALGPPQAEPTVAPADTQAVDRVEATLDQLDNLSELLAVDPSYIVEPLDYELPSDFKLSIVIPVYNEEETLVQILSQVRALPIPKEIILVDDFSTDRTRQLLEPLEQLPDMQIIYKPKNAGKGAALRTGFQHATGDVVVIQDADLEYDPRDIPTVLKPIVQGEADVVYGSRFLHKEQQDPSFLHRLGNGMLTWASNRLTGLRLTDMETCYKAFRRSALRTIEIKQNRFGFEPEVTAKIARRKYRVSEVPIHYNARGYEEGKKIGIRDAFNALYCIIRYGLSD